MVFSHAAARARFTRARLTREHVPRTSIGLLKRWPAAMSIDLAEIRSRMPSYNPNSTLDDRILWLPSSNGIYLAASAMESFRTPHPLVSWYEIVWFLQNISRMGFIIWLAIKGRLSTLDRVQRYDPQVVTTCPL
ncbi:hypothetical protein Ddye_005177 [Dipteronia dyeriana]|uniref:Reverse transcriptase zinc-binding domain-containing protein n=1 Tax=Dipteronia dyeriana TaxID=168575 RepID=A0AAE0CPH9_9ROSI|nr:hypothetical protein Ddye_005177 [Dipteronia dyeriana]